MAHQAFGYTVVYERDPETGHICASVPALDLASHGRYLADARAMIREALELHLEGLIEEGLPIPDPSPIARHQRNRDYAGGVWAVVEVDPGNLRTRAKRINITLPERVLDSIDRFAAREGESRSGLLVKAATTYIAARQPAKRRRSA